MGNCLKFNLSKSRQEQRSAMLRYTYTCRLNDNTKPTIESERKAIDVGHVQMGNTRLLHGNGEGRLATDRSNETLKVKVHD